MSSLAFELIKKDPSEILRLVIKVILFFLPGFGQEDVYFRRRAKMLYFLARAGLYESRYLKALPLFVRKGDVVADIGANFGVYTQLMSGLAGGQGKVLAFEPLSGAYSALAELCRNLPNVSCHKLGIAAESGEFQIKIPLLFGRIPEPALASLADISAPAQTEMINVHKLDDFSEQLSGVTFIKVDIEGLEREFFSGAEKVIKSFRPVVQFEADKLPESESFLRDLCAKFDSRIVYLEADSVFHELKDFNAVPQNLYLVPSEKINLLPFAG